MSSRQWVLYLGCLTLLLAPACDDSAPDQGGDWTNVCVDADGDGYGLQCPAGADCNDGDRTIWVGCGKCDKPAEGCPCDPGTSPVQCMETPEVTSSGSLLCKEGTRYCRDSEWSGCEGLSSFTAPPPSQVQGLKLKALLASDAAVTCDVCSPDCFEIQDPIDVTGGMDGGTFGDSGIAYTNNGSVTVGGSNTDAAVNKDELTPTPPCDMSATSTDKDCDGIPDALDPFPSAPPFASDHQTIFMDLAPGQSGTNTFDLRFYLKSADVYFLVDMTGSMNDEKNNLISSLKTGDFLDNPNTPANESASTECADIDFKDGPNNELKSKGVAGNIACLIRSAGLGAGWYREIPYSSSDSSGIEYAYPNLEPFEHRQDIVADATAIDSLSSALNGFVTRGNQNWAEAGGVALSAVANGGQIYMGWDRPGIPARTCPEGHFGYPCFRNDAMPIVVLITDAPLMNGPTPASGNLGTYSSNSETSTKQPVNYEAKGLAYTNHSSDARYNPVSGNESYDSAFVATDVHTTFKTYTGSTRLMAADIYTANHNMSCSTFPSTTSASRGYPDAVFRFTVTDPNKSVLISTRGTRFKPSLSVFPVTGSSARTISPTDNPTIAKAADVGSILGSERVTASGDTTSSPRFDSGELTSGMLTSGCVPANSYDTGPDAWFKFTVPSNRNNVKFRLQADYSPILGVWAGTPSTSNRSLGCTYGTDSSFNVNLESGVTYYMVLRGQRVGRGPYTITIGESSAACAYDNTEYTAKSNPADSSYDLDNAEIEQNFPVGDYYVVLKGKDDIVTQATSEKGRGWYQLTIGDKSLAVNNQTAVMPQWGNASGGIQKDLLDKGIRVITVASVKSCSGCAGGMTSANNALKAQADLVSQTTKAIGSTENTRDFEIYNDGRGLGYAIVNSIAKLSNNVAMDVSVRFVPLPDTPTKPFQFTARAIDIAGDSCKTPIDTNGDGILDTHTQCTPGAAPRFEITIKNPAAPNNVPVNPAAGSNGGYNMRIEMVADGKYVIDSTPVFVIPQDIVPDPPAYLYGTMGLYTQDIAAACSGTDRPTWQYLEWHDTLPADTSLVWRVCAGESATELNTCQNNNKLITVANVTRGTTCTTSDSCTNGFCGTGVCHYPVSPSNSCTTATDCGSEAACVSGVCAWKANPISVVPALRSGENGKKMLRLQVQMNSSPDRLRAPTIHDFKVKYVCSPGV